MTHEEAKLFAQKSFIESFEPGNEHLIDQYFAEDLEFYNHSIAKSYSLAQVKMGAEEAFKKYQHFRSELKDIVVEDNQIAFRVEQQAYYIEEEEHITMEVMNLYTLVDGKVKSWRLWDHGYIKKEKEC